MPAVLLAAALAVGTASGAAAAPLKTKPHVLTASSVQSTHGRGHATHHGMLSPPKVAHRPPPPAAAPAPANATAPQRVSFDVSVGVAAPAGRATTIAVAPQAAAQAPPSSLGGILSLPQQGLFGQNGAAGLAATGPWQIIAAAEGLALLALVVTLVRRRRVSNRPLR